MVLYLDEIVMAAIIKYGKVSKEIISAIICFCKKMGAEYHYGRKKIIDHHVVIANGFYELKKEISEDEKEKLKDIVKNAYAYLEKIDAIDIVLRVLWAEDVTQITASKILNDSLKSILISLYEKGYIEEIVVGQETHYKITKLGMARLNLSYHQKETELFRWVLNALGYEEELLVEFVSTKENSRNFEFNKETTSELINFCQSKWFKKELERLCKKA